MTVEYDALAAAWHPLPPHPHPGSVGILLMAAKSMRDELLARIDELEVCGNCGHIELGSRSESDWYERPTVECDGLFKASDEDHEHDWPLGGFGLTDFHDHCHFTPSRWTPRRGGEAT